MDIRASSKGLLGMGEVGLEKENIGRDLIINLSLFLAFPSASINEAFESSNNEQFFSTGQGVVTTEETSIAIVDILYVKEEKIIYKKSWSFEKVYPYFHLPMIQAMKELEERLVKDVQQFGRFRWDIDRRETVKKLEDEREQMLRDFNLELDVKTKT
nr:hypothetical protein Iba_chr09cCG11770 [Ipomoea batatas]